MEKNYDAFISLILNLNWRKRNAFIIELLNE